MRRILLIALVATIGCKKQGRPEREVAVRHLSEIGSAIKKAHQEKGAFPVGEIGLTPAKRCCVNSDGRCPVDTASWQHPVWKAIGFSVTKPQSFQYSYKSDGKTFSATAVGDDGCDGTTITYEYRGQSKDGTTSSQLIIPPREQPADREVALLSPELQANVADRDVAPLSPKLEANVAEKDRTPITLTFGWHPPCRVPILAETEKRGQTALARMVAVLEPHGDKLALRVEKLEVLEINGQPADSPLVAPQIAMLQAVMAAGLPTRWISQQGEYLGIDDIDQTLDAITKALPQTPELPRVMQAMKSPSMRAMIEQNAGEQWNTWVAMWIGLEVAPGSTVDRSVALELPDGTVVAVPSQIQHRGTIEGGAGLVLLESTQLLEGPGAAQLLAGVMKNMSEAVGGAPPPTVKDFSRQTTILAAMEAATSRVHRVRTETKVTAGATVVRDIKDFAFDWSKAEGCARPLGGPARR